MDVARSLPFYISKIKGFSLALENWKRFGEEGRKKERKEIFAITHTPQE
jgi:hypothetical protein